MLADGARLARSAAGSSLASADHSSEPDVEPRAERLRDLRERRHRGGSLPGVPTCSSSFCATSTGPMLRAPMPVASLLTALVALSAVGSRSSAAPLMIAWYCLFSVASISWVLAASSIDTADRRWTVRPGAPLSLLVGSLWIVVAPVACSVATLTAHHDSTAECACEGSFVEGLTALARAAGVWQFVVVVLSVLLGPSFVRQTPRGLARVRGPLEWPMDGHAHA